MAFWILSMYHKILTEKPNNNFPPAFFPSNLCLGQFIVSQSIFTTVMKYLKPSNFFFLMRTSLLSPHFWRWHWHQHGAGESYGNIIVMEGLFERDNILIEVKENGKAGGPTQASSELP